MPKDQQLVNPQQVKFVREGETLNKDTFAPIMKRFVEEAFQDPRKKDPDETNMQYMRNVKAVQIANVLKAKVFFDKFFGMLTPEQKQKIYDDASEKAKETLKTCALRTLSGQALSLDAYKNIDRKLTKHEYADEQERERLKGEKQTMENRFNSLTARGRTLEEAREIVGPYMTEEQLNKALDPKEQFINERFMRNNFEYMSDKLKDILTPEQMAELNATVNDYVMPWERKPEEMGEKAYTAESEKAKADIDAMQNLSPEQKEAMKADIDAANDFLRQPSKIEDPIAFYQELSASNSGYDSALMKDEEARGKDRAEKEGLDLGAVEERPNEKTFNVDVVVVEGKEEAYQKLENEDYKFAPETKEAIKHLYTKMQEYGYLGNGIVLEQGTKKYGLSKLSDAIDAYKDAIESGDATRIAETSKAMMTEQAHADELIGYVREHFPVDPKSDNFARSGNVDVVRNDNFPPKYRMDEAVACLNSMYIMASFVDANGLDIDELLDHPMKVAKDYFLEKKNQGLNNALKGKTGGEALFEASRDKAKVKALGFGGARPFEALIYADKDPAIRAHNNALWKYMDTAVVNNGDMLDVQRRDVAYKQGHLDRFLFVSEPRDNASLLGVPIYNVKTLKYDQPEAFDEAAYLQNNGKSVGEMKETLDKNLKEFLHLRKTQLYLTINGVLQEQPAYGDNKFVEIAQQAASKILMAKHAEKDDPAYEQLKGILTNGQEYVNNLIQAEKDKVLDAEKQMEEATKAGDAKKVEELKAYIDANKAFKEIKIQTTEQQTKYAENLAAFEKKVAECDVKRPAGADVKPDEVFNRSIQQMNAEIASINSRISERVIAVGAQNVAKDDEVQLLNIARNDKLAEIAKAKEEYIKQLDEDVKAGRIYGSYKEARLNQLNDPDYKYDNLPDFFPQTADPKTHQKEVEAFALKQNAEKLGFVNTVPEAPEKPAPAVEKQAEKEQQADFTGRWFKPGKEVTADDLLAKVSEVSTRLATPIEGYNWLKNREEHEARGYEKGRLQVVFDEGYATLSDESKQQLYDTLDDEAKQKSKNAAIYEYHKLLGADGKSEESKALSKTIFEKENELTLAEVEKMAANFLTDQEKANPSLKAYNKIGFAQIEGKNTAAWELLVKGIPEDKLQSIAHHADAKQAPMESMTLEEARESLYATEINSLKTTLDQMSYLGGEEMTKARKEKINAMLDRADSMTSTINANYKDNLADIRLKREEGEYGMNATRKRIALEQLKKNGFDVSSGSRSDISFNGSERVNVKYSGSFNGEALNVIKPEALDEFEQMRERKFQLRPETKQKAKDIFAKFDKYGFDDTPFEAEEGIKIYGLHHYTDAMSDFIAKAQSKDPLERIKAVDAAEKMTQEYDKAKEMIDMSRDLFGTDRGGYYPGNLDVQRTAGLPPEFRHDLGGVSAFNGMYVLYRTLKQNNVDVDKFLEDPRAFVQAQIQQEIKKLDPNQSIKGKSGAEAIFNLGTHSSAINPLGDLAFSRSIQTIAMMETDPEMVRNNVETEYAHMMTDAYMLTATGQRDMLLLAGDRNLDRFLIVNEPQEDASLLGVPMYDYKTMTLMPAREFDEIEYLINKNENPKQFADRITEEGVKLMAMRFEDLNGKNVMNDNLTAGHVTRMMQRAALKYIATHPDMDKKSEAYRTLNSMVNDAPTFVKNKLNEAIKEGKYDVEIDEDEIDSVKKRAPEQSIDSFRKSREIKNFGEDVRAADKQQNRTLKNLQAQLESAKKNLSRAGNDVARAQAQQQIQEVQNRLNEAVAGRKAQLMEEFRNGNITEDYLNRRNAQLDQGKFGDNPPKMFDADQPMSKNDYLNDYAKKFNEKNPDADFSLDELSKEQKDELYQRYVEGAKRAKDQFIARKYLESENVLDKVVQKTLSERIAEEDARLTRMGEAPIKPKVEEKVEEKKVEEQKVEQAQPEVKQEEPKKEQPEVKQDEPKVENGKVEIDLDEEIEFEIKQQEKVEDKAQEKEEDLDLNADAEQISVDLDDDDVEMLNDILNFSGQEKDLEKDKGPLGMGGV